MLFGMAKEIDLQQILKGLGSDLARNIAISKLVGKIDLPTSQVWRVAAYYERARRFYAEASYAHEVEWKERAKELYRRAVVNYEKVGRFRAAADVALEAGMIEKTEQLIALVNLINE